jgi:hypothetical protein
MRCTSRNVTKFHLDGNKKKSGKHKQTLNILNGDRILC